MKKTIKDMMAELRPLKNDRDYIKEFLRGERYRDPEGTFFYSKKEALEYYRDLKKETK